MIEAYPSGKYLPSFLLRGESLGQVLHAQIATDVEGDKVRVRDIEVKVKPPFGSPSNSRSGR